MAFHYLPAFTRTNGVRQQAACGAYIFPSQHSTTPNCERCMDYLTAESAAMAGHDDDIEALRRMDPLYVPDSATLK